MDLIKIETRNFTSLFLNITLITFTLSITSPFFGLFYILHMFVLKGKKNQFTKKTITKECVWNIIKQTHTGKNSHDWLIKYILFCLFFDTFLTWTLVWSTEPGNLSDKWNQIYKRKNYNYNICSTFLLTLKKMWPGHDVC